MHDQMTGDIEKLLSKLSATLSRFKRDPLIDIPDEIEVNAAGPDCTGEYLEELNSYQAVNSIDWEEVTDKWFTEHEEVLFRLTASSFLFIVPNLLKLAIKYKGRSNNGGVIIHHVIFRLTGATLRDDLLSLLNRNEVAELVDAIDLVQETHFGSYFHAEMIRLRSALFD